MNTNHEPNFSSTNNADVPSAPPEAHQKARVKTWIEEAFVKFAFKLLSAADCGCHSIAANEYAADHPLGEGTIKRPIQSWCKGFLEGWRR